MRNSGKPSEIELERRPEVENEWGIWKKFKKWIVRTESENRMRFVSKCRRKKNTLSREKVGNSENEMPCMGKGIPKEETYNKYGAMRGN